MTRALTFAIIVIGATNASAQFTPITYSYNARLQDWLPAFGGGAVTFGGVPFDIPTAGDNVWQSSDPWTTGPNPRSLTIPVNIYGVDQVNTLINSWWGESALGTEASIRFLGSGGASYTYNLDGGTDTRDYLQGNHANTINGSTTTNVFTSGNTRIDMQTIALPPVFLTQTLTSIQLTDNGLDWLGVYSPYEQREYLAGLTVRQLSNTNNNAPALAAPQTPHNLVLVTHGWAGPLPGGNPTSDGWVAQMTAAIANHLPSGDHTNWQVVGYDWYNDSTNSVNPDVALVNAVSDGEHAGADIAHGNYSYVHLIAHSAGAALIASAGEQVAVGSSATNIHYTFLDPYTPSSVLVNGQVPTLYGSMSPQTWYGAHRPQDWADNYYAHDSTQFFPTASTEAKFVNAHNVDVTNLDPNVNSTPITQPLSSHSWPYQYYMATVINGGMYPGTPDVHGSNLSLEGGHKALGASQWQNPISSFGYNPNSPAELDASTYNAATPQVRIDPAVTFIASISHSGGNVSPIGATDLNFSTSTTAWDRITIYRSTSINAITLHAIFSSLAGSKGVFEVYLDDKPIGQINERYSLNGNQVYAFGFDTIAPGFHDLAFRFDRLVGNDIVSVDVSDVRTAFVPAPEPATALLACIGSMLLVHKRCRRLLSLM